MPTPAPRRTHPLVKAAALALVGTAAVVGVWAGSFRSRPRSEPAETTGAPDAQFLPATDSVSVDPSADRGATVFDQRCAGCHTIGEGDREGPDLARAAFRRDPTWVNAMILAPDSMFRTDSVARWLLTVHEVPPEQATEDNPDLRALADFFASFAPAAARRRAAPAPD
jgi:mono/diheme cytochrome c family protein